MILNLPGLFMKILVFLLLNFKRVVHSIRSLKMEKNEVYNICSSNKEINKIKMKSPQTAQIKWNQTVYYGLI